MSVKGETETGIPGSWSRLEAFFLDGTAKKDTPKSQALEMHVPGRDPAAQV